MMSTLGRRERSKVDFAYEELKGLVLRHEFMPNQHLRIETISERLGVGVTPVREALVRLFSERLVDAQPARGFYVKPTTPENQKHLFELSFAIHRCAFECSIGRMRDIGLPSALKTYSINVLEKQATLDDIHGHVVAFDRLSIDIVSCTGNLEMVRTAVTCAERTRYLRCIAFQTDAHMAACKTCIDTLADAIHMLDHPVAVAAVRAFVDHLCENVANWASTALPREPVV